MMEVQDSAHCPEWNIVQSPSKEEPATSTKHSMLAFCNRNHRLQNRDIVPHYCLNVSNTSQDGSFIKRPLAVPIVTQF
jgi:hypothetical protein